jgi:exodeoxyribonuclease VII large subunit
MNLFDLENIENNISPKESDKSAETVFTVSKYLDGLNSNLKKHKAKIVGEIFGIQEYVGRSYMYFSIKDKEDSSTIKCFMWKRDYDSSGVKLEEGLEVLLTAYPAIYKPNGGLSLQVSFIELVGEGALKLAYEKLKKQLETEGLLSDDRKRPIPEFPKKIGVITSKSGAVINDFLTNIGKFGFELLFVDSKVEGDGAVKDLLTALRILYKENVDCLVVMRGGGSLESFQAFNNENIVRAISKFNAPVITGIGHDKDVPLVSLVSDKNVSTPTAVANLLNQGFLKARGDINLFEHKIINLFDENINNKMYFINQSVSIIENHFQKIFHKFEYFKNFIENQFKNIENVIANNFTNISNTSKQIVSFFENNLLRQKNENLNIEKNLKNFDPNKRLSQGYSIVRFKGKVLKKTKDVKENQELDIQVSDGIIKVKSI